MTIVKFNNIAHKLRQSYNTFNNHMQPKQKLTKIIILDILTKLYIIYAYILMQCQTMVKRKENDNRPLITLREAS
jgi:hypothetical protein